MTVSINGTSGLVFNDASVQNTSAFTGGFAFRNRIINGAMVISQRGTSFVSPTDAYTIDRWEVREDTDGAVTVTQETDAPTGFVNSLKVSTTTADASLGATQRVHIGQFIEGLNCGDLSFGSASASTVTLSFWVKSSLTGTFGGILSNSARNRSYPFTYTVNAANTWEYITITITGDTTGTWLKTNGIGLRVYFGLGVGSTYSGTAGSWQASELYSSSGAVSVIGTLNATWQVTGVQLEKGSTATSFDYRPYGTELALCQRYFQSYNGDGAALKVVMPYQSAATTGELDAYMVLPVPMRSAPSAAISNLTAYDGVNAASSLTSITLYLNTSSIFGCYFASSGLTLYRPYMVRTASGTTGYLQLSAEL
jgi:hypothetical protein